MPDRRDPDFDEILRNVRDGLTELEKNVISRWGRVPHLAVDPVSPPDGAVWIRSDLKKLLYRANGTTIGGRSPVILTDSAQAVASGSLTDITWGTEVADVDGWTAGGISILTCPTGADGNVAITFNVAWSTSALGTTPYIVLNAAGLAYVASGLTDIGRHTVCVVVPIAATNTIVCQVKQNSGAGVTVSSRIDIVPVP